jgi:hypothetical protein
MSPSSFGDCIASSKHKPWQKTFPRNLPQPAGSFFANATDSPKNVGVQSTQGTLLCVLVPLWFNSAGLPGITFANSGSLPSIPGTGRQPP